MTPCVKMGSDENHFNVSLIVRDKVTRQCPRTTTFEESKYCGVLRPVNRYGYLRASFEEKGENNNKNNNNSYIAQYPVTIDDGRERWKRTVQEGGGYL